MFAFSALRTEKVKKTLKTVKISYFEQNVSFLTSFLVKKLNILRHEQALERVWLWQTQWVLRCVPRSLTG